VRPTALVVDDHASFRRLAGQLLAAAGYDVVGEADGVEAAVEAARRLRPALVLLDVMLPDGDGFEAADRLSDLAGTRVLLTSSRSRADFGAALADRWFLAKSDLTIARLTPETSDG
jgi:CheY-like chemotaxis protein